VIAGNVVVGTVVVVVVDSVVELAPDVVVAVVDETVTTDVDDGATVSLATVPEAHASSNNASVTAVSRSPLAIDTPPVRW